MGKRLTFDSIEPEPSGRQELSPSGDTPNQSRRRSRVIVKVVDAGYVPEGFELAIRIDPTMFTALASNDSIAAASIDSRVISVARSRRV